ncbi:UNVERIFIED_CONTAM: hypothetical protein NCL1_33593 [Trichonephila clavipes]
MKSLKRRNSSRVKRKLEMAPATKGGIELWKEITSMLILDQQQRGNIGVGNAILPLKNLQLMSVGDYESKMRNCLYATYPLAYKIEHLVSFFLVIDKLF